MANQQKSTAVRAQNIRAFIQQQKMQRAISVEMSQNEWEWVWSYLELVRIDPSSPQTTRSRIAELQAKLPEVKVSGEYEINI